MINITHKGEWEIQHIKDGEIIKKEFVKNIVTNLSLDEWADALTGSASDIEIKYMALGTNGTTVTAADTQLGTDVSRIADISLSRVSTGQTRSEFEITDAQALFEIEEMGVFCGSTATTSFNTGLMLSRINWNLDRTSNPTSIRFIRRDTLERK